jgi:hypothetical protein
MLRTQRETTVEFYGARHGMDMRTVFGGSPLMVILRLLLMSLVVGIVLSALGIDLNNFMYRLSSLLRDVWDLGFRSIDWVLQYTLLGAVVVVPIWLVARLAGGIKKGPD